MKNVVIDLEKISTIYKPMSIKTHKGTQGHVLVIGGSYGKVGSIVLCSKAALKSGCGLVTAFIPKCGYDVVQISFPEAMVLTDDNEKCISRIEFEMEPTAIAIGMGMGQEMLTQKAFHQFIKSNEKPLLVDADGINMLSKNKDWLTLLPENSILTPHQKELERLVGNWKNNTEKINLAQDFAKKYNLIVVIKGSPTLIVDGKNQFKNTTGNPALATAGSGDSLSGIITSFMAQSYKPLDAAILGVYLHGLTADIAVPSTSYESFVASDISENLGKAFLSLKKK